MDVLICDDEPDVQLLLRLHVEALGHGTRCVDRAEAAIEAIRERVPDLLLLDVSMPEMDGPSLLRRLRALGLEVPTILVSAITREELRALSHELQVSYLPKPFTLDHVRDAFTAAA